MFSGIITDLGKLVKKEDSTMTFQAEKTFCKNLTLGTSIAVNGVCLTVDEKNQDTFSSNVMPETFKKTTLGNLQMGALVNLELPVTPETLLSGHIVQGHVDGVGKISAIEEEGNSKILTITIPRELSRYIVTKGSIAVNGISLTVIEAENDYCTVGIIPYTGKHTMLYTIKKGESVNIETDILGKYIEKLLEGREDESKKRCKDCHCK